ncbi:SpoIID/LytB domain-containing protein [Patescibacteria group bacterium]|nr:SpoIID/LytB domain-containing protein [Patescibacteria group bacterium]
MQNRFLYLVFAFVLVISQLNVVLAQSDYASQWVGQSDYLTLTGGEEQEVWVEFENTGNATWNRQGDYAVHLGTARDLDRSSSFFESTTWLSDNRIEMQQNVVHPGETARFEFTIQAPYSGGVYYEYFRPVVENVTWMNDVGLFWEFRVVTSAGYEDMCMSKDSNLQSDGCVVPENWMYDSKWKEQSDYVTLKPGEKRDVWVEFANEGVATWYQNGDFAVHLGTANPVDRNSGFVDSSWLTSNRIIMEDLRITPLQKARFKFSVKAPMQEGVYHEYFRPVVENVTWLRDEGVFWTFVVDNDADGQDEGVEENDDLIVEDDYAASLVEQTGEPYFVVGEEENVQLQVKYKNIGQTTWTRSGSTQVQLGTSNPHDRNSGFVTSDWLNTHRIEMDQEQVTSGGYATFTFDVFPSEMVDVGTHKEHFALVVGDNWLADSEIYWNMVLSSLVSSSAKITADKSFDLVNGSSGHVIDILGAGEQVTVDYAGGNYRVKWPGESLVTADYVRMEGDRNTIFELQSYNDIKSWNSSLNDNLFRDTIEVRYSPNSSALWVINELSMEDYIAGVAETSDSSPKEFIKALMVAARSYAVRHVSNGGRHPENYADLYNSVGGNGDDQVYRGYGFELRNTQVGQAVKDTKGKVVTYDGKVALTPYFSRSDGRTRSFEEVWGSKNYPWCVSVPDPYNEGMSLNGHGVGMSALGALRFAEEEGKTYDWILKYYYTGIDVSSYNTDNMRVRVGIYSVK